MNTGLFDYSRPLVGAEVCVYLLNIGNRPDLSIISRGILGAAEKYNFDFHPIHKINYNTSHQNAIVKLLIIVADHAFDMTLVTQAIDVMAARRFTCVSIAFEYDSSEAMDSAIGDIEKCKAATNDRINFLRPIRMNNDRFTVPHEKIVDNAICDGVRIKYNPLCLSHRPIRLAPRHWTFFSDAARLYSDHRLYHRSPSDGYFAIRSQRNAGSFYITATKTCKYNLELNRISEVVDYDEHSNVLKYRGSYLPSSDSVEAAIILRYLRNVRTIIHTHASEMFTRNREFQHKVKVPMAPYGECEAGLLIRDALIGEDDNFIIMEDHGEVFTSEDDNVSSTLLNHLGITAKA